jgi:hypothetical protein
MSWTPEVTPCRNMKLGFEWQPVKQFELVAAYSYANRRFEDHVLQNNIAKGNSIRIQAQVNF